MKRAWKLTALVATGLVTLGGGFFAGHAWAGGIPSTAALTYSGTLEDAAGAALTGTHNIQVNFWNAAAGGTTPVCQTASTPISLSAGHFSVSLPDTCTAAVKSSPDSWAEVEVDGASLGRTKIGAVPYAVEAGHATNADNATNATTAATANAAGGPLAATVSALQAPVAARYGANSTQLSMTTAFAEYVPTFDRKDWDTNAAFDTTSSTFTCPKTGKYRVNYQGALTDTSQTWINMVVRLYNGSTYVASGLTAVAGNPSIGGSATFVLTATVACAQSEKLQIRLLSETGGITVFANGNKTVLFVEFEWVAP